MAQSKVNLSLSPEQAAFLMPLLEQLSATVPETSTPRRTTTMNRWSSTIPALGSSTPPALSPSTSSSECQYSTDELFERKKKNAKSTPAQLSSGKSEFHRHQPLC